MDELGMRMAVRTRLQSFPQIRGDVYESSGASRIAPGHHHVFGAAPGKSGKLEIKPRRGLTEARGSRARQGGRANNSFPTE